MAFMQNIGLMIGVMAVTLGVLIAFHEYGHFMVARRCGVKVLEFSIGFGPSLWSFNDKQGTKFSLAAFPLGGFVKMVDEREGDVPDELLPYAFTQKTVWQRIAIVSAGPIANFLLAIFVYWLVFLPGTDFLKAEVFSVEQDSIAERAGLNVGDVITAVDGEPVSHAGEVLLQLLERLGETGTIEITVNQSQQLSFEVEQWLGDAEVEVDILRDLGFDYYYPDISLVIERVMPASPALAAGLQAGDEIVSVDGLKLDGWEAWVEYVRARPEVSMQVDVLRVGELKSFTLTPKRIAQNGETIGQVGVAPVIPQMPEGLVVHQDYGVVGAIVPALKRTWQTSLFTLSSIKKMILGQLSYKQLSGPISIAKVATQSAQSGIYSYLSLLALLSVSLGVLNLLPIPVLDGGHILFYLIEWVKGSPVPEKIQVLALQLGVSVVLAIMILAFVNDIARLSQ